MLAILKALLLHGVQEHLWRQCAKRAWIREHIQAPRGFSDEDADYAEPPSDMLAICMMLVVHICLLSTGKHGLQL